MVGDGPGGRIILGHGGTDGASILMENNWVGPVSKSGARRARGCNWQGARTRISLITRFWPASPIGLAKSFPQ